MNHCANARLTSGKKALITRYQVYGGDEYKTLCFDLNEGEPVPYHISASSDENETNE